MMRTLPQPLSMLESPSAGGGSISVSPLIDRLFFYRREAQKIADRR